ncbi:MAG: polyamine aminopropyltransferase [Candidatus Latescibacterota bacterium]
MESDASLPDAPERVPSPLGVALLLGAILAAAACAIVYELLIGSTAAYFLGDSVEQFSLTIGLFLFAMGVGSWLSRLVERDLLARFVALEIWLGLVGGTAVALLYCLFAYTAHFRYGAALLILAIGTLIGLEVPLLARILRRFGPLRTTLSSVLSMDYVGSLVASLLFPYLLLPVLGALHASVVTGMANAGIGAAVLVAFRADLGRRTRWLSLQAGGVGLLLAVLLVASGPLVESWESALYVDPIVHSEQSRYQKIVLTRRGQDVRLYLNGHLQFASVDEHRYHESLVHPAMALAAPTERVLILGGGDGLAAREVLQYPQVHRVELVDLDPAMTRLGRRHPHLARLNRNALNRPEVHIVNEDAFTFLQRDHEPYGVVIIDLPDPREEALTKLYSVEGYRMCRRLLAPHGMLVTQAGSPYFSRRAYWSIAATLEVAGFHVYPYHVQVPSFGEWGFHLASAAAVDPRAAEFTVPRRFLDAVTFRAMLRFDVDMARVDAPPNSLDRPVLARYYREDWAAW